jgi:hypothetical protein
MSHLEWNPAERVLRQFTALGLALLAGLAWWHARQGHAASAIVCLALAVLAGPLFLAWPRLVQPLFVGAMVLAFPIGWVVNWLALALLFYGALTPLGLLFKLCGRDALCRRSEPKLDSYWVARSTPEVRSYFRTF